MRIRITKCSNSDYWYVDEIGNTYKVLATNYETNEHIIKYPYFGLFGGKSIDINDAIWI